MLGWKIEERHQLIAVFLQAQCGLGIFGFIGFQEQIECLVRIGFRLGLPDIVQRCLGFWLGQLGQAIEHIHRLMLPTSLLPTFRKHLFQRRPEPHGTVPGGQFRRVHSALFEFEQNFPPALGRLAHAVFDGQKMLLTTGIYANNNKGAQLVLFAAQAAVNTVSPDVDPWFFVQRLCFPAVIFLCPIALEA